MKKLLVPALFLFIAPFTNAEFHLSYNENTDVSEVFDVAPSTDFFIGLYQDTDNAFWEELWIIIGGTVSYTGYGTIHSPPAPTPPIIIDDGGYGYGWIHFYFPSPQSETGDVGIWWDLELHCDGPGDAIFEMYDSSGYQIIDTITVHQIPEPMTITLLAFGGLLLRKRR